MTFFLKLEHAAILIAAVTAYVLLGFSWQMFAILILAPDLSFAAYLIGPKIGAWCYNAAHTWILPVMIAGIGVATGWEWAFPIALISTAHIAFDRMLGYGLKHESSFQDTHLGRIGRA